jgi:hypothetical protein
VDKDRPFLGLLLFKFHENEKEISTCTWFLKYSDLMKTFIHQCYSECSFLLIFLSPVNKENGRHNNRSIKLFSASVKTAKKIFLEE